MAVVVVDDRDLELVLADRTRVPVVGEMTIGRGPGSTLQLDDPAVSRRQARISNADGLVMLEDAGSTYGTWLDGHRVNNRRPLRDGSRIRIGNQELLVERRRDAAEAGRTVVVQPGESLVVPASGGYPKVRSGYALKRLEASEGPRRWVLQRAGVESLPPHVRCRCGAVPARRRQAVARRARGRGPATVWRSGPPRLARLLSELAERGLLSGVDAAEEAASPAGPLQRLSAPRELTWTGAGAVFERLYRRGGWTLFTAPALAGSRC